MEPSDHLIDLYIKLLGTGKLTKNSPFVNECIEIIEKELQADPYDCSILHIVAAINDEFYKIMQVVIEKDVNVNATDDLKSTPLHIAALYGQLKAARLLIMHNAHVNPPNFQGITPLHWTARFGHLQTAKLLLAHGANLYARDENNETPLDFARVYKKPELIELFQYCSSPQYWKNFIVSLQGDFGLCLSLQQFLFLEIPRIVKVLY